MRQTPTDPKEAVRTFWNDAPCGEVYAVDGKLDSHAAMRYRLEPDIPRFARFAEGSGRDVLEVGIGMGADHAEWAKAKPRLLVGVDLTTSAVTYTRQRLAASGMMARVAIADAENLPFAPDRFDIVYSWGVLHHSPDTAKAVGEVLRVLRPGGIARVMIYNRHALVGYLLWLRYAALAGRPLRGLKDIYANHVESPGTKAYTLREARELFKGFSNVNLKVGLSVGDLLEGAAGQRHQGPLLAVAKAVWPRRLIRTMFAQNGLFLMIEAVK